MGNGHQRYKPLRPCWALSLLLLVAGALNAAEPATGLADIETDVGTITVELYGAEAPKTVAQFQKLASKGWYKDRTFYRVVKDFVIQTGSGNGNNPTTKFQKLPDEFNARPHIKGALAIAKGAEPNSGSTEFFIDLQEMPGMNGHYVVFAQVVAGMDVVDAIANAPVTESWGGPEQKTPFHKPIKPVKIKAIKLRTASAEAAATVPQP